ncbi:hypothetical protein SAMN02927937_02711 [Paenimyroides aquimaris]|uniref:DUF2946 domain-containing protein n=1 Tax=Paenimyroides marinum TaxID=1159016 RepID=A0A1H6MHD5_9FLAO|nr:hypothetical protein [Paenimyroides aquimaris]SEI01029.1 hypothetical protein SAMN02927937_02711 [Paenimyroides aquimaris]
MKSNKRIISLFFSICVLVTLMFQSAHTYSHLITDFFDAGSHHTKNDPLANHHPDNCQICHFTLSPFTTVTPDVIVFYSSITYPKLNVTHHTSYVDASFDVISLRGPPIFV